MKLHVLRPNSCVEKQGPINPWKADLLQPVHTYLGEGLLSLLFQLPTILASRDQRYELELVHAHRL